MIPFYERYAAISFAPAGLNVFTTVPTANAVGCILPPLRGYPKSGAKHASAESPLYTNTPAPMFSIMCPANSLVLTFVAPDIRRSKS